MPKIKYSPYIKIKVAQEYLSGKKTLLMIARELGYECKNSTPPGHITRWIKQYVAYGEAAFITPKGNNIYTKEFKKLVVKEYLSGGCSLLDLSIKYKIPNEYIVSSWIKKYNANIELKDYIPKREVYMAEARRKTTIEERKEIVKYCINHHRNYKETASIYDVSYSQVHSWVKKYDTYGEEGLFDKRGHHKSDNEVDELERLRRENLRLKRQLEESEMTVELLKKVKELEGM